MSKAAPDIVDKDLVAAVNLDKVAMTIKVFSRLIFYVKGCPGHLGR
jgi:hypothetical protein